MRKAGLLTDTTKSTSSGYSSLKQLPPLSHSKSPLPQLPQQLAGSRMPLLGSEADDQGVRYISAHGYLIECSFLNVGYCTLV